MKGEGIVPIKSSPGVKRDGTEFEGSTYVDAQHCRFRRGLPRKIGGWRAITQSLQGPIHSVEVHSANGVNRIYFGSSSALEYTEVTADGIGGGVGDVTPAALAAYNDNLWTFGEMYDSGSTASILLAHAAPNLSMIDATTKTKVWYGSITGTAALADSTAPSVAGGVFCAPPYGFTLDDDGLITWCAPNTPTNWATGGAGSARITKSKLVFGASVRGAGVLTFLVWSLDTLVRGAFTGGTAIFNFNELGTISLMSSRSVVEYNGVFYWMGLDRFQMFNGVIQDLPNAYNLDYLLEGTDNDPGINMNQRQKVWGVAIPKFGEIWWFYPRGSATECTHVVILNVAQGTIWYDTQMARTAGNNGSVFRYPVMIDAAVSQNTFVRVLHGTASASAGTAGNAFDGNMATVCSAGVNGNIAYDFGQNVTKVVKRVSLQAGAAMTTPSAVLVEYSVDTGTSISTWTTLISIPSQAWVTGTIYDFDLTTPVTVRGIRVSVSGGATLEMEEVYIYSYGALCHQHEFGYDAIVGSSVIAIPSWFETADISYIDGGPVPSDGGWSGREENIEIARVEPDFVQVGQMSVTMNSRPYAKSTQVATDTKTFDDDTEKVDFKRQGTIVRFKFESNTQGGFYQMGQPLIKIGEGDGHR